MKTFRFAITVDAAAACNVALVSERTQAHMWIFDVSAHAVRMTGGMTDIIQWTYYSTVMNVV